MTLNRRNKKFTGTLLTRGSSKFLVCKECNICNVEVSPETGAVTCARCVQRMIAPPPMFQKKSNNEKFPRGWHFKKRYVHINGDVYCRGVLDGKEQFTSASTDVDEITRSKKRVKKTIHRIKRK